MPLAMPRPQMPLSLRYMSVVSLFGLLFALNSCRHYLKKYKLLYHTGHSPTRRGEITREIFSASVTYSAPNPTIGVRGSQHETEDMTVEDDKIIDLFWMRDQTAIQETNTKYGGKLQRLAIKILYSREDAEESVNDTYLSA